MVGDTTAPSRSLVDACSPPWQPMVHGLWFGRRCDERSDRSAAAQVDREVSFIYLVPEHHTFGAEAHAL